MGSIIYDDFDFDFGFDFDFVRRRRSLSAHRDRGRLVAVEERQAALVDRIVR
jgi:hypothetical protein